MKLKIIFLSVVLNLIFILAHTQNVTLYAGHPDTPGYSPVHTSKLSFYFNSPFGLAFDSKGNLWISNFDGCTIASLCAQDGQIYSRTGNNSNGFRNGSASYALFYSPAGMTVGLNDTVFVADMDNHVIRRISPMVACNTNVNVDVKAGKFTYNLPADPKYQSYPGFANGAPTVAQFHSPTDVIFDKKNNCLYVADAGNNCIRKIASNGVVSSYAGKCGKAGGFSDDIRDSALFNWPVSLALGSNGDLYVADEMNSAIRKISGNNVTTVLDNSNDTIFNPLGMAFKNNKTLFISDNGRILKSIPYPTKTYAGIYNGTAYMNGFGRTARFDEAHDLVFDPVDTNTFYVADMTNHVIRKVVDCTPFTPKVTATQTVFCKGDSAILTVQNNYSSYSWSNGAKTKSIVVKLNGSYTCTVIDVNTCPGTSAPINITTTNLQPYVTPDGPLTFCNGDSVILVGESGLTYYKWYKGTNLIKQGNQGLAQSITVKTSGNYYLEGTKNLCHGNSVTLTVTAGSQVIPIINIAGDTTLCPGDTVILSTSTSFLTYDWKKDGVSNGNHSRQCTITSTGKYEVYVTQAGCNGSSVPIQVTLHPAPVKPTITKNDTVLTASNSTTYQWYRNGVKINGATNQVLNATRNAKYIVVTTNSDGCKATSDPVIVGVVSIAELDARNYFEVFPNPSNGILNIKFKNQKPTVVNITITDIFGKTVLNKIEKTAGYTTENFNLSMLEKGMYLVTVKIGDKIGTLKLLIK